MKLLIRIMVKINPYLNDNGVKFHALYNILYASSFQLATFINHSRFLVSIDLQNETVCSLWTVDIQSISIVSMSFI